MKLRLSLVLSVCMPIVGMAGTQTQDVKTQAVDLVRKAVVYAKQNGKEALLKEVNMASGLFHVKPGGDVYIFVFDMKGQALAHGFQSSLVNINRWDHKDADGKYFVREFVAMASLAKGAGWVDYKYPNPKTKTVESKTSYVEGVDGMVVGCGVYK